MQESIDFSADDSAIADKLWLSRKSASQNNNILPSGICIYSIHSLNNIFIDRCVYVSATSTNFVYTCEAVVHHLQKVEQTHNHCLYIT